MAELRIGVSGWTYDHWRRGAFYPTGLRQRDELSFLSRQLRSVEINGSFYSLLTPDAYRRYRDATPDDFLFAVKGGRFITHNKKLREVAVPLANFFASGLLRLEEKLGPILWQLPAMRFEPSRIAEFLAFLPRDQREASRLARRHDHRVTGRASMVVHENRPIRHALEVRHPSSLVEEVARACREHDTALVVSDSGSWPYTEEVTASFVYLRLHGSPHTYASEYGDRLAGWAERIRVWISGGEPLDARRISGRPAPRRSARDAYVYFDNDGSAHAPRDALRLMEQLGVAAPAGLVHPPSAVGHRSAARAQRSSVAF